LQQNPQLAAAMKALSASQSTLAQNWNGVLPNLDLNAGVARSKTQGTDASTSWNAGGTASVDVFNMGSYAAISRARAGVAQAQASLEQTAANILFSLHSAFISLLYAQADQSVSEAIKVL